MPRAHNRDRAIAAIAHIAASNPVAMITLFIPDSGHITENIQWGGRTLEFTTPGSPLLLLSLILQGDFHFLQ